MKITKKILQNIIKEELEALISEAVGTGSPFGPVRGKEMGQDQERYRTRADAAAALAAAAKDDGQGTLDAKLGDHHQMIAVLQKRVGALEEVVRNIEENLRVGPRKTGSSN